MRRILQSMLIAAMGVAVTSCGSEDIILPAPTYFNVSGQVIGNGSNISDVIITDGVHSAVPDSTGKWILYRLPNGEYTLSARKKGLTFLPAEQQFTLKGKDVSNLIFVVVADSTGMTDCPDSTGHGDSTDYSDSTGSIAMVTLAGGSFMMGLSGNHDATPVHKVTVSGFRIGKYEITQREWKKVMPSNPSGFNGDNSPVERVTWYDAVAFCNALSLKDGFTPAYTINGSEVSCNFNANGYRLPTEAEWEYAARAGTATAQYSAPVDALAWYSENSGGTTHAVGQKRANQFGLYDIYGNIFEWCWDWRSLYTDASQTNPTGPSTGSLKILRGGSWYFEAHAQNSGFRLAYDPSVQYNGVGFRVVRSIR